MDEEALVELKNFGKYFTIHKDIKITSVEKLNFKIVKGKTFGLVGESGSGKTTCGRTLVNAYPPTEGTIIYDGKDILDMTYREKINLRKKVQIIFQNSYAALEPHMTISEIIKKRIDIFFPDRCIEAQQRQMEKLLYFLGFNQSQINSQIYQLADDKRQKIDIALALASEPELIVCDEPISSSDSNFQDELIYILKSLQEELGLTYLFVSKNLSAIKDSSDQIGIMWSGILVELTNGHFLKGNKVHPYTKYLLANRAQQAIRTKVKPFLENHTVASKKLGCPFIERCSFSMPICQYIQPELTEVEPDHFIACHLYA